MPMFDRHMECKTPSNNTGSEDWFLWWYRQVSCRVRTRSVNIRLHLHYPVMKTPGGKQINRAIRCYASSRREVIIVEV